MLNFDWESEKLLDSSISCFQISFTYSDTFSDELISFQQILIVRKVIFESQARRVGSKTRPTSDELFDSRGNLIYRGVI